MRSGLPLGLKLLSRSWSRGSESDSKSRGYVGGGKDLATVKLYTQVYEFKPLSEEVTTLRLGASEACRLEYACELQGL